MSAKKTSRTEWAVYALACPDTGEIRYVGQSRAVRRRYYQHCCPSSNRGKSHRQAWIRSLLREGKKPEFIVLEYCQDLDAAEVKWIERLRGCGARLTNQAEGGRVMPPVRQNRLQSRLPASSPVRTVCSTISHWIGDFQQKGNREAAAGLLSLRESIKVAYKLAEAENGVEWFYRALYRAFPSMRYKHPELSQ